MDWEAGYVDGASTETLRKFAAAVRGGADVKVWVITGTGIVFVRDLPWVAVAQDEGPVVGTEATAAAVGPGGDFPPRGVPTVCGAVTDALDTQLDPASGRDVARPLAFEWQAFNTTQRRVVIKWPKITNCFLGLFCRRVRPIDTQDDRRNISWLVRKGWELVYEHEADGSPLFGSLDHILFYAQEGYDIKVRYFERLGNQEIQWFRTLRHVTTFQSGFERTIISGTIADIPTTTFAITPGQPFPTAELVFERLPFATEWHVYNTTGKRRLVRFRVSSGGVIADQLQRLRVGWYVRRNAQVGKAIEMDKRLMSNVMTPE